ncbi:hypothetical protein LHJ74_23895 [Streptomyces sp. N2-109]|uniref:Integral membrane protein n=1 Tax=Streptomyces gossypii TaxID=2883101 RepID=A0ABT2JYD8_9ACTN|nr:hypothetical protein [Streptomyces gossypii]MCT2592918.1 hypothetical protein [Streptomyces gossypii]
MNTVETTTSPAAVESAPAPVRPPERWAVRAAHLTVLCVLPSSLWRSLLAVGVPLGYSAEVMRENYQAPGSGTVYMLGLSLLAEVLAFLTLGLVRPWGEAVPRWVPVLGGRPVVPRTAVRVAAAGAVLLTLVFTVVPLVQTFVVDPGAGELDGGWLWLMRACYLPVLAWGPLLACVTLSYHRRHRESGRSGKGVAA